MESITKELLCKKYLLSCKDIFEIAKLISRSTASELAVGRDYCSRNKVPMRIDKKED